MWIQKIKAENIEERKWTQLNITWEIVEIGLFISMDFINFDKALELEMKRIWMNVAPRS